MSRFLIIFFLVYGLMHTYAFLRAKPVFSVRTSAGAGIMLFALVMLFAPVVIRYLESLGLEFTARLFSHIGYIWMGILFFFVAASLIVDTYRLSMYAAGFMLHKDFSGITPSARSAFFVPLILSLSAGMYGIFEAGNIRTERLTIETPALTADSGGIKIVQISDVHLGLVVRERRLKKIIREIRAADPDILVSTGDLVDGQINRLNGLADMLKDIRPRYGKYAVTGNHEFYAGLDQALDFTEKAGFRVLRGEVVDIAGVIRVAGVDDRTAKQFGRFTGPSEAELLSGRSSEKFTLLLKHRPYVDERAAGLFDLQLSGHTHKGQIFPFSLLTHLHYKHDAGYLRLRGDSGLYISRGSGTWGPPMRVLSPPEVTIIELVPENNPQAG